jgi:hypothetical protein
MTRALQSPDPLTREMIGEVMDMGARAKGWLRNLPWSQAEAGMREVDEMIATVSECLPGGYRDRCECGAAIGNDDPVFADDDGDLACQICATPTPKPLRGHTRAQAEAREIIADDGIVLKSPNQESEHA